MNAQKEVMELLKTHGEELRHNRHQAFRVNGHLITITGTKTDDRGWLNKRAEIRRALKTAATASLWLGTECRGRVC